MPMQALVLEVDAAAAERLSNALLATGALVIDIADAAAGTAAERPLFAAAAPTRTLWSRQRLKALFAENADVPARLAQALREANLAPPLAYEIENVDDRDWVRETQRQFGPIRISPQLWIVPSWHAAPEPGAVNVVLDPGLAFGTGAHPSTRLCLRWLEERIRGGETVLDFGCGSGILAIAALKLGAGFARGVDIDPQAVLAACDNAMQNRVNDRFAVTAEAGGEPAPIVVANILARPLVMLAPLLTRLTAPGGRIALCGILEGQAEEVRAAYADEFDVRLAAQDEGWALLEGVKAA
ncbi:MAG TPA: 50S ribosomal protein L11 methyltransferase [Burkholderiales bacterium]|nr:50S ribosomal protein L11 methyltransferase [Burkholderiales bacterium]